MQPPTQLFHGNEELFRARKKNSQRFLADGLIIPICKDIYGSLRSIVGKTPLSNIAKSKSVRPEPVEGRAEKGDPGSLRINLEKQ